VIHDTTPFLPPSILSFLQDYVQPSIPVIFSKGSGLLDQWQGVERWKEWEWVVGRVGEERIVSVNVTPDGRGDAILEMRKEIERKVEEEKRVERKTQNFKGTEGRKEGRPGSPSSPPSLPPRSPPHPRRVFVKPEERRMAFGAFVDILLHGEDEGGRESGREEGVFYLSQQNDNMRVDFPMFISDGQGAREEGGEEGQVPAAGFPIARHVFGHAPDAINLWIGGRRSVSSVHKDPYENMYAVLKGEKVGGRGLPSLPALPPSLPPFRLHFLVIFSFPLACHPLSPLRHVLSLPPLPGASTSF